MGSALREGGRRRLEARRVRSGAAPSFWPINLARALPGGSGASQSPVRPLVRPHAQIAHLQPLQQLLVEGMGSCVHLEGKEGPFSITTKGGRGGQLGRAGREGAGPAKCAEGLLTRNEANRAPGHVRLEMSTFVRTALFDLPRRGLPRSLRSAQARGFASAQSTAAPTEIGSVTVKGSCALVAASLVLRTETMKLVGHEGPVIGATPGEARCRPRRAWRRRPHPARCRRQRSRKRRGTPAAVHPRTAL